MPIPVSSIQQNAATITEDSSATPDSKASLSPWVYVAALALITIVVYCRLFSANFVGWDDDIHVYKNPFLNPPTLTGIAGFWKQPYENLYIPLSYTVYGLIAHFAQMRPAFIASVGETITVKAAYFHGVNVALHTVNAVLAFLLLRRMVRNDPACFAGALLFAIHPLQVESVGWISEMRGLLSSTFSLSALLSFMRFRSAGGASRLIWGWYASTLLLTVCALLCKPSAVVLPLAALAIDMVVFKSGWRKSLTVVAPWLILAAPFVLITRNIQAVTGDAYTTLWQRPFIAGDALSFYIGKLLVPVGLAIDYGRKPHLLLSHAWAYSMWLIPLAGLALAWRARRARPLVWLGALLFVVFLLPELGLIPFQFQHFSTVADRYIYVSMLGIALIAADLLSRASLRTLSIVMVVVALPLGALTVAQTGYWHSTLRLMNHELVVNPRSDVAYNNRGLLYLGNKDYAYAESDFKQAIAMNPLNDQAMVNLGKVYADTGYTTDARAQLQSAIAINPTNGDAISDLGNILIQMGDYTDGVAALRHACDLAPENPLLRYNLALAYANHGDSADAITGYKQVLQMTPNMSVAHMGMGSALAVSGDLTDATKEFQEALRLNPDEPGAKQNLEQAQKMMAHQITP